jgi:CRISPR-associated protein Csx3
MTRLNPGDLLYNVEFSALVERIKEIFGRYTREQLEQWHLSQPQVLPGSVVHLPEQLAILAPENDEDAWPTNLLKPLLESLSEQTAFSVYGRGPAWLYGALAVYAGTRPFQQFDARIGWVTPPSLQAAATVKEATSDILPIEGPFASDDTYAIALYPAYNYLDFSLAEQLKAPEPLPQRGVIVSGKLPLWLFTALARFYWQRNVPWIALNDARTNQAVVIYSRVASHSPGKRLPMPKIG